MTTDDVSDANMEVLMGPRAKADIEAGNVRPITKEQARTTVTEESKKHREQLVKEVESELTPQQQEILEQLRKAKGSEERVKVFGQIADDFGLDALVSLIPELGDGASSIVAGIYLLMEAKHADLGIGSYLKIIGLEAADFAVGAIPVAGDVADYFFKANKWAGKDFEKQTRELVEKARQAGVPEEKIAQIEKRASSLPRLAGKAVSLAKVYKMKKGASGSLSPDVSDLKEAA